MEESTYGILCVTKENVHAPWLTFEAGALSKTMTKSAVSPFLFDIKRSEVNGPILQFQSTIFDKEDLRKLVYSLNRACGEDTLTDERLEKAFQVWYPNLEQQLNTLLQNRPQIPVVDPEEETIDSSSEILEEILDLTRNNQKLLRNPEGDFLKEIEAIKVTLEKVGRRLDLDIEPRRRRSRKMHPMFFEELMHMSPRFEKNLVGFQMAISLFRSDFPWLYDAGIDVAKTLRNDSAPPEERREAVQAFQELVEFTFEHPMMREMYMPDKEVWMMGRELPRILMRTLDRYLN